MTMPRTSLLSVFSFFLFTGRKARRTRVFFMIGGLPVLVALVIQASVLFSADATVDGPSIFSNVIMAFELQFLIVVVALFYGTSVVSEELEGKTLTYLTTRPVNKTALILGKYAAYGFFLVIMVAASVLLSFVILNIERISDLSAWATMLRGLGVLELGLLGYLAFFTMVGTFLKKSVLFGLFFGFGWENVVQYFPGATQKFTLMHYLKSLLPAASTGNAGKLSFLMIGQQPSPPVASIATLLALTIVFLAAACLVFARKEYLFEE
jgi:ABC-2 type transport system permease protein